MFAWAGAAFLVAAYNVQIKHIPWIDADISPDSPIAAAVIVAVPLAYSFVGFLLYAIAQSQDLANFCRPELAGAAVQLAIPPPWQHRGDFESSRRRPTSGPRHARAVTKDNRGCLGRSEARCGDAKFAAAVCGKADCTESRDRLRMGIYTARHRGVTGSVPHSPLVLEQSSRALEGAWRRLAFV